MAASMPQTRTALGLAAFFLGLAAAFFLGLAAAFFCARAHTYTLQRMITASDLMAHYARMGCHGM